MIAMSTHDWTLPARYPLCPPADSLYRTGQAIFHNLSGAVTPDMINAAQDALAQYRTELLSTLHPMHFGLSVGRHVCVEQVYQEGRARLRGLTVTSQPAPEPPAPPRPKRRSLADMLMQFAEEGSQTSEGEGNDAVPGIDE
jgi:hypothetical protein